jgi:uncharacterized membrane protein YoaK (UPF0700 family)
MPVRYARFLTGRHRSAGADRQLGFALAFVAGAINAGGFLAVQQYTSHVTGMVSSMADNLVLGRIGLVVDAVVAVIAFLLGAMTSAMLVNFARRHDLHAQYALPLVLEAMLILVFGLAGAQLARFEGLLVPFTVVLLCFIMGLQNAVVTKLSGGVVRTTHMTGVVTDLGIELGKRAYWNRDRHRSHRVLADRARIAVLGGLLGSFVAGALVGAFAFATVGYVFTVPIALLLLALAAVPLLDDLGLIRRR